MSADPVSSGIIEKALEWIILGLATVVAWLFRGHHARISTLENTAMRKDDFYKYETKADVSRSELRESIIKLYDRIDELKSLLLDRK